MRRHVRMAADPHVLREQPMEQRALTGDAPRRLEVERGARRERHEVEAVLGELMKNERKQRDSEASTKSFLPVTLSRWMFCRAISEFEQT